MQVWAGSICAGPDRVKISATYEHSQKVEFQDSVGASIAAIAATVPDGLLVFLPSYSMLDRLMERWKVRDRHLCPQIAPLYMFCMKLNVAESICQNYHTLSWSVREL